MPKINLLLLHKAGGRVVCFGGWFVLENCNGWSEKTNKLKILSIKTQFVNSLLTNVFYTI